MVLQAFTVLHSSGLLKKVFDNRQELMQILQQVSNSEGYKNVTNHEFLQVQDHTPCGQHKEYLRWSSHSDSIKAIFGRMKEAGNGMRLTC